jgi:hypothetical protein
MGDYKMHTDKEYTLQSLNKMFCHLIHPVQMKQVRRIQPAEFTKWLQVAKMGKGERRAYMKALAALKDRDDYVAILLEGVRLQHAKLTGQAVIIAPSGKLKPLLANNDIFGVIPLADDDDDDDDDDIMEFCHYNSCFCANPSNCSCVSASAPKGDGPCPGSSCTSAKDCGDGSSDPGDDTANVFETLSGF